MSATRVMSCDEHGVDLEHGRLDADTIIWAAGVVASPASRWLDVQHDRAGRVNVRADLSVPAHPSIFVVGDTANVVDQPGIPGTAAAAKQMGRYVGRLIAAHAARGPSPPPFHYRHKGDLATIGRQAAVVKLGASNSRASSVGYSGAWCTFISSSRHATALSSHSPGCGSTSLSSVAHD
jgi:NADH dehydrogenase